MHYVLTDEGESYLRNGLPERKLIEFLEKFGGKAPISEIEKEVENLSIALLWAKKKGWIEIKFNDIILIKKPDDYPEEKALKNIKEGKIEEVEKDILEILIQRKLVEKVSYSYLEELRGKEIISLTPELIKTGFWRNVKIKEYSLETPPAKIYRGKSHPYIKIINEVREFLISLGFKEAKGPFVELEFWNCDALFMPSDHIAREIHDIFFIDGEGRIERKDILENVKKVHKICWGYWDENLSKKLILRSHNTAISVRELSKISELPIKVFVIDRVFRPDVIDAKHFIEFEQCEGIVADENLNFRNLLGYLREIAKIFGSEEVKFKPSYFPFTEPSVEMYVKIKDLGWVEVGGAGIFREEVTRPLGINVPVLAWGLGLGRLAMLKLRVNDIRYLYSDDLSWLREVDV
ncbi:MAG: phenylalanine--tRNA ligase subunit alpha [Candidatus Aenigmatarchaeota archaeon]